MGTAPDEVADAVVERLTHSGVHKIPEEARAFDLSPKTPVKTTFSTLGTLVVTVAMGVTLWFGLGNKVDAAASEGRVAAGEAKVAVTKAGAVADKVGENSTEIALLKQAQETLARAQDEDRKARETQRAENQAEHQQLLKAIYSLRR